MRVAPAAMSLMLVLVTLVGCPWQRPAPVSGGSVEPPAQRPEDRERIRDLEAETRRLKSVIRAAKPSDAIEPAAEPEPPSLAAAQGLFDAGELDAALDLGLQVLDGLNDGGVDAPRLAFLLGEWATSAGQHPLAERLFGEAAAGAEASADLVDAARAQQKIARAAALGPDAAALAEAKASYEAGDLGQALQTLADLSESGQDLDVLVAAEELAVQWRVEAAEIAVERLDRADALLAGPGPWEAVGELLDGIESLPEGTWDLAELRRLRAWYRTRSREEGAVEAVAEGEALQALLDEARGHMAAERYRDAVAGYAKLEGTPLQTQARGESRAAVDSLVKGERERAGRLFVAARKNPDPTLKEVALQELAALLRGLAEEFPDSSYAGRVLDNLTVVQKELAKME